MKQGVLKGLDYSSPLVRYRGERVARLTRVLLDDPVHIDHVLAVDVFYTLYLPAPVLKEEIEYTEAGILVSSILTSKIGMVLRSKSVLDVLTSLLASAVILSEYYRRRLNVGNGGFQTDNPALRAEKALEKAQREIETVSKIRAFVEGLQAGTGSVFSVEDYGLELLKLAREADVKEVLRFLEGIKHWDITPSRHYTRSKHGEKLGYELGFDIERACPRNFAYPPEVFYARLAEGKLLLYEKGVETSTGPVYVLIDKSGSMEGEKILWAKAVTLALYTKAVKSRRNFYARFFDSQPYQLVAVKKSSKLLEVTRAFEYIAKVKSAGGTDITRALLAALSDMDNMGIKDSTLVLITDGIDRVGERSVANMLRKTKTSLVTVMVRGDNPSLRRLSIAYLAITKLTTSGILKVVKITDRLSSTS